MNNEILKTMILEILTKNKEMTISEICTKLDNIISYQKTSALCNSLLKGNKIKEKVIKIGTYKIEVKHLLERGWTPWLRENWEEIKDKEFITVDKEKRLYSVNNT